MTAGVRPNIDLAKQAGLHCERAIVVDDTLQTYDPRVYAVGECVQHRTATFGLVAPISGSARVCGAHLAGAGHRRYVQRATATQAEGHRRRTVFGRRLHRRPGQRRPRAARSARAASTSAS